MNIRPERPGDESAIAAVIEVAFLNAAHRDGTEASIVERLRAAGALNISLVAVDADEVVGHIAFSSVTIDGAYLGWFGLGPIAVVPDRQGGGIGSQLVQTGLEMLQNKGAAGCVLVGEPAYYQRFGFRPDARLTFPGIPPEYFQVLSFGGELPSGTVAYHPAFG